MCAPSNVAADALCAKVVRTGAKVLRVYAPRSEHKVLVLLNYFDYLFT
jgi:hypothetical protein